MPYQRIPFIYEDPFKTYLKDLKKAFSLETIKSKKSTEFERMLSLSKWLGTRWDHGTDPLPGEPKNFDLIKTINQGEKGKKFWCEIAAELSVHAASALGWPARLVTLSRDGYTWEHAVAEYWSNQFNKWFVIDTDFNILYMSNGRPLSAFEICHKAEALKKKGALEVIRFAPPKKNLPIQDMLPFYRYIHIDMRNDWFTRKLHRGSPAGGDLSTWWTARCDLPPLLTIRKRVDDPARFDWPINFTCIHALGATVTKNRLKLQLGLSGYSPFAKFWQVSIDQGPWASVPLPETLSVTLEHGEHIISARMVLTQDNQGPESTVCFNF